MKFKFGKAQRARIALLINQISVSDAMRADATDAISERLWLESSVQAQVLLADEHGIELPGLKQARTILASIERDRADERARHGAMLRVGG